MLFTGFIKLQSKNPFDPPIIDPKYFSEDSDIKVLVEGVKIAHALSNTPAFQSIGSTLIEYPDCAHITKYTDSYWECMIRHYTQSIYHSVGEFIIYYIYKKSKFAKTRSTIFSHSLQFMLTFIYSIINSAAHCFTTFISNLVVLPYLLPKRSKSISKFLPKGITF